MQLDWTFGSLFASLFSPRVYDDNFFVNFIDHFVPLLLERATSFLRSLRNAVLRTETRPLREKLNRQTVEGEENRQNAIATEKSWSLMITWWNTNTENENTENNSQKNVV